MRSSRAPQRLDGPATRFPSSGSRSTPPPPPAPVASCSRHSCTLCYPQHRQRHAPPPLPERHKAPSVHAVLALLASIAATTASASPLRLPPRLDITPAPYLPPPPPKRPPRHHSPREPPRPGLPGPAPPPPPGPHFVPPIPRRQPQRGPLGEYPDAASVRAGADGHVFEQPYEVTLDNEAIVPPRLTLDQDGDEPVWSPVTEFRFWGVLVHDKRSVATIRATADPFESDDPSLPRGWGSEHTSSTTHAGSEPLIIGISVMLACMIVITMVIAIFWRRARTRRRKAREKEEREARRRKRRIARGEDPDAPDGADGEKSDDERAQEASPTVVASARENDLGGLRKRGRGWTFKWRKGKPMPRTKTTSVGSVIARTRTRASASLPNSPHPRSAATSPAHSPRTSLSGPCPSPLSSSRPTASSMRAQSPHPTSPPPPISRSLSPVQPAPSAVQERDTDGGALPPLPPAYRPSQRHQPASSPRASHDNGGVCPAAASARANEKAAAVAASTETPRERAEREAHESLEAEEQARLDAEERRAEVSAHLATDDKAVLASLAASSSAPSAPSAPPAQNGASAPPLELDDEGFEALEAGLAAPSAPSASTPPASSSSSATLPAPPSHFVPSFSPFDLPYRTYPLPPQPSPPSTRAPLPSPSTPTTAHISERAREKMAEAGFDEEDEEEQALLRVAASTPRDLERLDLMFAGSPHREAAGAAAPAYQASAPPLEHVEGAEAEEDADAGAGPTAPPMPDSHAPSAPPLLPPSSPSSPTSTPSPSAPPASP